MSSDAIELSGISSSSEAASISFELLEDEGSDPASSWFVSRCSCSSSSSALRLWAACSFLALPSRYVVLVGPCLAAGSPPWITTGPAAGGKSCTGCF